MSITLGTVGTALTFLVDREQKATYKGKEIAKLGTLSRRKCGDYEVEITGFKAIPCGVEYYARAWKDNVQIGFGADGTVDIERFRVYNPPIFIPDGTTHETVRNGVTYELDNFKEDLEGALLLDVAHTLDVKQQKHGDKNIVTGKLGSTTSTFFPDTGSGGGNTSVDGYVAQLYGALGNGQSWATIIAAAGTNANDSGADFLQVLIFSDNVNANWLRLYRAIMLYDISAIAPGDTIDSATESLYGVSKSDTFTVPIAPDGNIYESAPASDNALVAGDFDSFSAVAFSTAITAAAFTAGAYNVYPMNAAGKTFIETAQAGDGIVKLGWRNANYDVAANSPTWESTKFADLVARDIDNAGAGQEPKLVIEHTGAAAVVPIGNLLLMGAG